MEPSSSPAELIASAEALILDFDGPVCDVYAGVDPASIARGIAAQFGLANSSDDPLDYILHAITNEGPVDEIHDHLTAAETAAIQSATETDGVRTLIQSFAGPIAVASNNATEAIESWLSSNGLRRNVAHVQGREPRLMKPDPYSLNRCSDEIQVERMQCVFIGDSASDGEAAKAAGMPFVALANRPLKRRRFLDQGSTSIVASIAELAEPKPAYD